MVNATRRISSDIAIAIFEVNCFETNLHHSLTDDGYRLTALQRSHNANRCSQPPGLYSLP